MSIEHLEVLVEEPSMEMALRQLLPRILGGISFQILVHEGKSDLLDKLSARLRGYAGFVGENWRILVLVDRDEDDCLSLKRRLDAAAESAGLVTKTRAPTASFTVLNRIAIEELEAWYFGDWAAVRMAYPKVPKSIPLKAKYRHPDRITGGTWEAFERVAKSAGYFQSGLRKIEAAQRIAGHMEPSRNTSPSFQAFYRALVTLTDEGKLGDA